MERLLLFTDAIFAIIMTLLALDVRLPPGVPITSNREAWAALGEVVPAVGAYIISFLVVGTQWNIHLKRYRYLTAVDGRVVAGTMLQLLCVGLIPFATSLLAHRPNSVIVSLYAGVILASILIGWITWSIATSRPERLTAHLTPAARRELTCRSAVASSTFAVSIVIAWWDPVLAMFSWLLQIPANALVRRFIRRP